MEAQGFIHNTHEDGTKHFRLPAAIKSFVFNGYSLDEIQLIMKPYSKDLQNYAVKLFNKEK
jgi:hypothetical protein